MPSPNIVVITTHDTGRFLGCYGRGFLTPHLDSLAAGGCLLEKAFCTSPVCSPSRGSMTTGQYPQRSGLMGLVHRPWDWKLNNPRRHLSHQFRAGGYQSILIGHQHESHHPQEDLGFETVHATNKPPATQVAAAFREFLSIGRDSTRPLYAQIGFFETHRPYLLPPRDISEAGATALPPWMKDDAALRHDMSGFYGSLREVDDAVGGILDSIREAGMENDTLVVFTTDHGIELPRAKFTCYDAGIEVALLARWPGGGIAAGARSSAIVSNVDLYPTLLEAAHLPIPTETDGESFLPLLQGKANRHREVIYSMFQGDELRCVRSPKHKVIRAFSPQRLWHLPIEIGKPAPAFELSTPYVQFFDLEADPLETRNLAEEPGAGGALEALDLSLFSWMRDVNDPLLTGPTPTPYYLEAIREYREKSGFGA